MNHFTAALFSGLFLASALFLALVGCDKKNCAPDAPCPPATPLPATCTNIAGSRNAFYSDSCGKRGRDVIVISQQRCSFNGNLPGLGTFDGTVSGTNLSFNLRFADPCSGTATGSASAAGSAILGSYSGTQSGASGSGCCSPVSGYFTFDFAPTPAPSATPTR